MAEPENHPLKKFFGRHWEIFAAGTSGFVGALALATSTYNVYLQRQQVRASVWPHVTAAPSFTDEGVLSLVVRNRGVGPAQLERFRVSVNGKPAEDWDGALKMILHKDVLPYAPGVERLHEEVLTPGMELAVLKIPTAADSQDILLAEADLTVEVCYCSTLDECWNLTMGEGTKPVSSCPQDPQPFVYMTDKTRLALHAMSRNAGLGTDAGSADAAVPAVAAATDAGPSPFDRR